MGVVKKKKCIMCDLTKGQHSTLSKLINGYIVINKDCVKLIASVALLAAPLMVVLDAMVDLGLVVGEPSGVVMVVGVLLVVVGVVLVVVHKHWLNVVVVAS